LWRRPIGGSSGLHDEAYTFNLIAGPAGVPPAVVDTPAS